MADRRILIADDNELVAQALEAQLKAFGYEVVGVAHSGKEVARLCDQLEPDLVIMEMQLPDLSEESLKQLSLRIHTPIVIMAAGSDAATIQKADEAGAMAYLVKPVKPEELSPAIDVALARHHDLQQIRQRVDDLHEALESRKLIERAKGILMKRLHLSDAEAEERLRTLAKEKKMRMQDVAQTIVDSDALLS